MRPDKSHIQPADAWQANEIGIYLGLPMAQYLAAPGASQSLLQTVAARPSSSLLPRGESTDYQRWGELLHDLVLSGGRSYHVRPDTYQNDDGETKAWTGNATVCKKWLKEHADLPVLRAGGDHSAEWLTKAAAKVSADSRSRDLLQLCIHREVSLFARHEEHHLLMKGRPDMLGIEPGRVVIADIKTTTDASTRAFSREILRFGYHKKFAHYRALFHSLGLSPVQAFFIIVEKGDDPRVQVRQLAERAMDKGDLDLDDDLAIYRRCRLANNWPDFSDDLEPHITGIIDLPDHCYGAVDDLSGMTEAEELTGTEASK